MVFIFGYIYYYIYKNKGKSYFIFLRDIERGRREQTSRKTNPMLKELRIKDDFFKKYIKDNEESRIKPKIKITFDTKRYDTEYIYDLKDGGCIKIHYYCDPHTPKRDWESSNEWKEPEPEYNYFVLLLDQDSNVKWSGYCEPGIEDSDPINRIIDEQFDSIQKNLDFLERCRKQPIWSYMNFVYFSTITQCTVGYGDILPNHTVIRTFVILQVILGYIILIVFINIILSTVNNHEYLPCFLT